MRTNKVFSVYLELLACRRFVACLDLKRLALDHEQETAAYR